MHRVSRRTLLSVIALAVAALALLPISALPTFAGDPPPPTDGHSFAPVAPPRPPAPQSQHKVTARARATSRPRLSLQSLSDHARDPVGLKLLVIAAQSDETVLDAIQAFLDEIGVPYDTLIATQTPLVSSMLWDGNSHGYYQGVLLTTGNLAYNNAGVWTSAFTDDRWQILWNYETMFNVRQATWFTATYGYPEDYGLNPVSELDTTNSHLQTQLTPAGQDVFSYLNPSAVIPLNDAYTYLATVISPTVTTPLVVTSDGYAIASITRYPDGRQNMAITASHSRYSMHSILLSYGVINWVSKGLYLGERHVSLDIQIDDILLWDSLWDTVALTNATILPYRLSGNEFDTVSNWQNGVRSSVPNAAALTLDMAFNGVGANLDYYLDPSLPPRVIADQSHFNWISHTYDHQLLNTISSSGTITELLTNDTVATQVLGLTNYHKDALVQPAISGLYNPDFQSGAAQFGIQYLVSDTYAPGWNNPSPNAGIYSSFQPSILIVPRHPFNVWYNESTPAELVSEYNYHYGPQGIRAPYWDHDLSYSEILDKESDVWLRYLLNWDIDPLEFHQPNLRAYDGTHSLLGDLVEATLAKYDALYNLPIRNVGMHQIGGLMANRMAYNASGVTGTWVPCSSITLATSNAALVPVTGLAYGGNTEMYGGQPISYIQLGAGGTTTLPTLLPCQTITLPAIADKTILNPPFSVNATASSGLPVSLTASGSCTMNGAILSLTGLGSCTITAHQDGNWTFDPAPVVNQTFNIVKAPQAITFGNIANKTIFDPPFAVTATASSGLPVSFAASGDCTIAANVVSLDGLGSCSLSARQAGNAIYNPAPDVQQTFAITKVGSTLVVSASANPSRAGQAVTLTATVTSVGGAGAAARLRRATPTGSVTFTIDGLGLGTVPVDANGVATRTIPGLGVGIHHVIATYSGDAVQLAASASFDETVLGNWYLPYIRNSR